MIMCRPQKRGFSLIECLIAILVMTFLLLGGMSFFTSSDEYLKAITAKRIAADLANSRLEYIKSENYINITAPKYPPCSGLWNSEGEKIGYLDGNISCCSDGPIISGVREYKHVKVKVEWLQPNHYNKWNETLETYIAQGT